MIRMNDLFQRIGFYLAIIDGSLDGLYYGTSLIYRYSGCRDVTAPYAQLEFAGIVPTLLPPQTFILASWLPVAKHIYETDPAGVAIVPGARDLITVAMNLKQGFNKFFPLQDCEYKAEVIWLPSGDTVQQNWSGLGHEINGTGTLYGQDILLHGSDSFVAVRITKTFGVLWFDEGFMTVRGGPATANLNPFACGAKATSGPGP